MDEQMNNNGYQYQPNPSPMPNPNKDGIAIAVLVLGIVSICFCCVAWGVISLACAIVSLVPVRSTAALPAAGLPTYCQLVPGANTSGHAAIFSAISCVLTG